MDLVRLATLIETLRKESIGEPLWLPQKEAFEYQECSAKVVAVLKLVRAMHGVHAVKLLISSGLFIDAGAILRCINDSTSEIYFLLEKFPNTSNTVDKFTEEFFSNTIDGYLMGEMNQIPTKKVRSAVVRVLTGVQDDITAIIYLSEQRQCANQISDRPVLRLK